MKRPIVVIAIMSAALAVMLSTGIRQSFGLFLTPISDDLGTGREVFSLAIAINNLIYGLPLVGILADRTGSRLVLAGGGLLYVAGLLLLRTVESAGGLYLTMGLMVGFALSATTYVVVLGAVGQLVPPERRSSTFGLITAAGSSGMFVVPPLAQALLSAYGWQTALVVLACVASIILILAFGLPASPRSEAAVTAARIEEEPFGQILTKARSHVGYFLLIGGFFVCGFHVAFIATHLPAYLGDAGLSQAVGAAALSLIGGFNMVGSFLFGWLGDRFRKKYLLSLVYLGRGIVMVAFLLVPLTQLSALVFAGAIGFLWLATVPLTSGTVAQIFGARYLSTLYGIVFLGHQLGAFLGVWLGGRSFDALGTYQPVWIIAIVLAFVAAVIHTPISDRPVVATTPAAAD